MVCVCVCRDENLGVCCEFLLLLSLSSSKGEGDRELLFCYRGACFFCCCNAAMCKDTDILSC